MKTGHAHLLLRIGVDLHMKELSFKAEELKPFGEIASPNAVIKRGIEGATFEVNAVEIELGLQRRL
ncbi:hypothetical protein HRbin08_02182 [bacterium HR08]|nr:hypothetical protein HRbin08_02182 [bacterium HR08]